MSKLREFVYLFFNTRQKKTIAFVVRWLVAICILANTALQVASFYVSNTAILNILDKIQFGFLIAFTVELGLRIYTGSLRFRELGFWKGTLKYIFSFYTVLDIVAIIPSYFGVNLTSLRLMRLFKFLPEKNRSKYVSSFSDVKQVLKSKKRILTTSVLFLLVIILISGILIYGIESKVNPSYDNLLSSFWWTIITITQIGYGDVVPITTLGRIFACVIAVCGILLIIVPTGIITAGFNEIYLKKQKEEEKATQKELLKENKMRLTNEEKEQVELFKQFLKSKRK